MTTEVELGALRPEATVEDAAATTAKGGEEQVPEPPEGAAPRTPWVLGFWPPDCERTSVRCVRPPVRSHLLQHLGEPNAG